MAQDTSISPAEEGNETLTRYYMGILVKDGVKYQTLYDEKMG